LLYYTKFKVLCKNKFKMLTKDKSKLLALPNSLILGDSSTKNQNPLRHTDFVETAQAASYNCRKSLVPMNMVSTSEFRALSPARRQIVAPSDNL